MNTKSMLAALAVLVLSTSAHALRPFDGTDAAVADPGALELEFGFGRVRQGSVSTVSVPAAVATYGLGHDTEVGLEAHYDRERDGLQDPYRTRVQNASIAFKHVLRPGSLQDQDGPSVAAECALLFPTSDGGGTGAGCTGIVSQQWDAFTAHLNLGLERTPERNTARSLSLIGEGPEAWRVRPVGELRWEADNAGGWERSLLAGVVIPASRELAFDAALRMGRSVDGDIREVRVGLTWSFEPAGKAEK